MSLIKGTLTFFKLSFQGEFDNSVTKIIEKLSSASFEKLFDDFKNINYGFVPFLYPQEEDFESAQLIFNNFIILKVRIDEKKINKNFFTIELEKAKNSFKIENNKEKISKSDLEFLKNSITKKILKNTSPSTEMLEIIIDINTNSIYTSKLNSKTFDILSHLFKISFDIIMFRPTFLEVIKNQLENPSLMDDLLRVLPTEI